MSLQDIKWNCISFSLLPNFKRIQKSNWEYTYDEKISLY